MPESAADAGAQIITTAEEDPFANLEDTPIDYFDYDLIEFNNLNAFKNALTYSPT